MNPKIAILFTCHNRKDKTIKCLKSLLQQNPSFDFDLYVCDDGSTDGTTDAITQLFPSAHIVQGDGKLFWNRGMISVMEAASKEKFDFFLMINDDVVFYENMLQLMICNHIDRTLYTVVGSVNNHEGVISYGGRNFDKKPLTYTNIIEPNGTIRKCDVANWNCFLIPFEVILKAGILDPVYEHGFGDYDYCYRLSRYNIPIYIAPDVVGECETNNSTNPLNNKKISRRKKLKIFYSNKGLPVKSWYTYTKRYGGKCWFFSFISPIVKGTIKILLNIPIN